VDEKVAQLRTAFLLDEYLKKKIEAYAASRFGCSVKLQTVIDESILGGFIIQLNDQLLDCSIQSQLKQIEQKLLGD
jgi:F-type H+-transporting ATPase subunit delta